VGWGGEPGGKWDPRIYPCHQPDLYTLNTGMRNYPKLVHTLSEKIRNHELLQALVTTYMWKAAFFEVLRTFFTHSLYTPFKKKYYAASENLNKSSCLYSFISKAAFNQWRWYKGTVIT
jgi:hypothetical protein